MSIYQSMQTFLNHTTVWYYHTTSALISQTPQMIPPVEAKPGQQMIKPAPKALPTVATTVANTT